LTVNDKKGTTVSADTSSILWDGRHSALNSLGDVRVLTSTQVSKEGNGILLVNETLKK